MSLKPSYTYDRESSTPFSKIIDELKKNYTKDLNIQYPPEVVRYEFGIDPYTDDKGKEHPFEPPRPCIRWGLHRACAEMSAGQLKSDTNDISKAIARKMIDESRDWYVRNWPKKTALSKELPKFRISPVSPGSQTATNPKWQRELSKDAIDRSVTQFKPLPEEKE